ncbi:hypothetical protein KIPB_010771, partial [Kipferlia bialata]|eukprot:g10771.t1
MGSVTNGLEVVSDDQCLRVASNLASVANVAPHAAISRMVEDLGLAEGARMPREGVPGAAPVVPDHDAARTVALSVHTQLFPSAEADSGEYYLLNAAPCLPPDLSADLGLVDVTLPPESVSAEPGEAATEKQLNRVIRRLRPELLKRFGAGGHTVPGYTMYTSLHPRVCDHCNCLILDYEYFTYNRSDVAGLDSIEYDLCLQCAHTEDPSALRFPVPKLKRTSVPQIERVTCWKGETGDVQFERPVIRTPLNPDVLRFPRPHVDVRKGTNGECQSDIALCQEAARELQNTIIPEFIERVNSLSFVPDAPADLLAEMHAAGINTRYLARIAEESTQPHICEMVVREMLSQVVCVLLRDALAFVAENDELSFADKVDRSRSVSIRYLNEIFGANGEREGAKEAWAYMGSLSVQKFGYKLDRDVLGKVFLPGCVRSICTSIGLVLDTEVEFDFSVEAPFTADDIVRLGCVLTQMRRPDEISETSVALSRAADLDTK